MERSTTDRIMGSRKRDISVKLMDTRTSQVEGVPSAMMFLLTILRDDATVRDNVVSFPERNITPTNSDVAVTTQR